jgi:hypothetical protein
MTVHVIPRRHALSAFADPRLLAFFVYGMSPHMSVKKRTLKAMTTWYTKRPRATVAKTMKTVIDSKTLAVASAGPFQHTAPSIPPVNWKMNCKSIMMKLSYFLLNPLCALVSGSIIKKMQ